MSTARGVSSWVLPFPLMPMMVILPPLHVYRRTRLFPSIVTLLLYVYAFQKLCAPTRVGHGHGVPVRADANILRLTELALNEATSGVCKDVCVFQSTSIWIMHMSKIVPM